MMKVVKVLRFVVFRRLWTDEDIERVGYKDSWFISDLIYPTRESAEKAMRKTGQTEYMIQEMWINVPELIQEVVK